jgi:hypothetical protein
MTADAFTGLLQARRVGPGRWVAKCPAHRDRSPSLSIAAGQDGRVLVYCFAGCSVVAESLAVSPHTIRMWVRKGRLLPVRICRRLLFFPDEVTRFVSETK